MEIIINKNASKQLYKLPQKIQNKFRNRILLFKQDQFHPLLNNHSVEGVYPGCRSINITGDYRALYSIQGDLFTFIEIGTHSELY